VSQPHHDRTPFARRTAVVVTAVAGLLFGVLALELVPWSWVPGGELVPAEVEEVFAAEAVARAEEYATVQRYLGWVSYAVSMLLSLVLGLTPWGARLVRRVGGRLRWWGTVVVGAAVLLLLGRSATLPFGAVAHHRSREYGISTQGWGAWALDEARSYAVGLVFTSLLLLVVVGAARRAPRYWFAWAGATAGVLVVAGSFLYPVLVEPVFNRFTPLQPGPLREAVFELADREGVTIDDVLVSDASKRTTTLNAYVSGFGGTRRVVLYDNLVDDLSRDRARVVIAHELAHAKYDDVLVGTLLGAVGSVAGIGLLSLLVESRRLRRRAGVRSSGDPAVVALVLALSAVGTFLGSPIQNTISRAVEARADRVALEATHEDQVFVEMQRELALAALSDPTPPALSQFWFGSHPTVLQRVGLPSSLERAR